MPLCYSNFKSFRNKSSRIFWFEQLLFSKVDKLTCKGQVGLGLAGKGQWRANTGCNQLSNAIGNSHATSIKIEGCPCKLWQPYHTSHMILTGVMQPPLGKFAITLPFFATFDIFLVQQISYILHDTRLSHATFLWKIGQVCNFGLILDILFQIRP